MDVPWFTLLTLSLLVALAFGYNRYVKSYRNKMISTYVFPKSITKKVCIVYPHLNENELQQVMKALKEYFHIINIAGKNKAIAMPSQVVDVAWHEFILFTKEYHRFCKRALGRYIHHTPAEAMRTRTDAQEDIKRTWRIACHRENINPLSPSKLPLLFAIDSKLKIDDGFKYELNCQKSSTSGGSYGCSGHCASHIGCSSGCSGSAGDGGCSGSSGGCSGGGCGGS